MYNLKLILLVSLYSSSKYVLGEYMPECVGKF